MPVLKLWIVFILALTLACAALGTPSSRTETPQMTTSATSQPETSKRQGNGQLNVVTATPNAKDLADAMIESEGLDVSYSTTEVFEVVERCGGLRAVWDALVDATITRRVFAGRQKGIHYNLDDGI